MIQPGDLRLHDRLLGQLGQGGGGVVWRANPRSRARLKRL
jgi:hypothetical protein